MPSINELSIAEKASNGQYDDRIIKVFENYNLDLMEFVSGPFRGYHSIYGLLAYHLKLDYKNHRLLRELYNILLYNKRNIRDRITHRQEQLNLSMRKGKLPSWSQAHELAYEELSKHSGAYLSKLVDVQPMEPRKPKEPKDENNCPKINYERYNLDNTSLDFPKSFSSAPKNGVEVEHLGDKMERFQRLNKPNNENPGNRKADSLNKSVPQADRLNVERMSNQTIESQNFPFDENYDVNYYPYNEMDKNGDLDLFNKLSQQRDSLVNGPFNERINDSKNEVPNKFYNPADASGKYPDHEIIKNQTLEVLIKPSDENVTLYTDLFNKPYQPMRRISGDVDNPLESIQEIHSENSKDSKQSNDDTLINTQKTNDMKHIESNKLHSQILKIKSRMGDNCTEFLHDPYNYTSKKTHLIYDINLMKHHRPNEIIDNVILNAQKEIKRSKELIEKIKIITKRYKSAV